MKSADLRIVFAGTPEFAAAHLQALLQAGLNIVAVYTQPDRPAGRGQRLTPSAVKQLALQHALPVYQPQTLRAAEAQAELAALQPDLLVVVAYGLILPQAVLDIPRLGCINSHASLLPRWRGAAPIQRAIQAGDTETGITIMQMDEGLDTGAMLLIRALPITSEHTAARLHDELALLGGQSIVDTLNDVAANRLVPVAQPEAGVCYAAKLDKAEAALDVSLPASLLARRIRAFNPAPGATLQLEGWPAPVKVWFAQALPAVSGTRPGQVVSATATGLDIATGDGVLRILEAQKPGAKRQDIGAFLNGSPYIVSP